MKLPLSDFDYLLPEELIAQTPLEDRAASRLLHLDKSTGEIQHRRFRDCAALLEPGDLLVMNDTRVSALRLYGNRPTGARVEALLLREAAPETYIALTRPAKKLRVGERIDFESGLVAEVVADLGEGLKHLRFPSGSASDLDAVGLAPLPPYIKASLADRSRYQTIYADRPGSAAAPTAGLHFTHDILVELQAKGVQIAKVTLDVSLDTFRPIQSEDAAEHLIHGEHCEVPEKTAQMIEAAAGRIIAVGTTTVRTLESLTTGKRRIQPGKMSTQIYITPGYEFKIIEGMFTNFHMPKTTMLLMISALAGREAVMEAYKQAVQQQYRFLSFGDSMLIL